MQPPLLGQEKRFCLMLFSTLHTQIILLAIVILCCIGGKNKNNNEKASGRAKRFKKNSALGFDMFSFAGINHESYREGTITYLFDRNKGK